MFKESTQYKNWIFKSKQELDHLQVAKFERGLKILAELNRDLMAQEHMNQQQQKDGSTSQAPQQQRVYVNLKKIIQPLEEKQYVIYYTNVIKDTIMRKTPSRSLKTYALTFFRRFYLRKTCIDYDPDYLLCAALFLGFKVAQMNVNLDLMKNICPFLKEKHTEKNIENILLLLEYEFYLINFLNYDFYVFCPFKAMLGFIYKMNKNQKALGIQIFSEETNVGVSAKEFELKCESLIDQTFLTDLLFLVSYSYISLACILITAEFYRIDTDSILLLLELNSTTFPNLAGFLEKTLPYIKEELRNLKILTDEEFALKKTRIYKFLKKNPKYVEKIERDRENAKLKMKNFNEIFDDNLINSDKGKAEEKFIQHKREREQK